MRKRLVLVVILLFCFNLTLISVAAAAMPDIDLTVWSREDLNQLLLDISAERSLHHEVSDESRSAVLDSVKSVTEGYYAAQGIDVTWAWHGWEYTYTRDMDFFTLETHLDYKDSENLNHKVSVNASLFKEGEAYRVYELSLDGVPSLSETVTPPADHLINLDDVVLNKKSGINFSLLPISDLSELESQAKRVLDAIHSTKNSSKVNDVLKNTVESYFSSRGIDKIDWPWFDYEYTANWNCYTEKTRISFKEGDTNHRDLPVFAELYPSGTSYEVVYLVIDGSEILDVRPDKTSDSMTRYLRAYTYNKALKLLDAGNYEEALSAFQALGDYAESSEKSALCQDHLNQSAYEAALSLYESGDYDGAEAAFLALGDYADSADRAQASRDAASEIIYQKASSLLDSGDVDGALSVFSEIRDYRDAAQQVENCQQAILERSYLEAISLQREGKYEEASAAFIALGDYKDSPDHVLSCQDAILAQAYQSAQSLMDEGEYSLAMTAFKELEDYQDAAEKVEACQELLYRRTYEHAESLFIQGKYAESSDIFSSLGDYQDSVARVTEIQTIVASLDREIVLPSAEVVLYQGDKLQLDPEVKTITSAAPEKTTIVFSSSNQAVAKVAKDGTVSGSKVGDAIIYCVAQDDPHVVTAAVVHVVPHVNRVVLDQKNLSLSIPEMNGNGQAKLFCTIEPADAFIQTGIWASSDESVAIVDQVGNVQAVSTGKAVVTFTSDDDSKGRKQAACSVSVVQAVTSLELSVTSGDVYIGKTVRLKPVIVPQNAVNKKITWSSSDESIATVNAKGEVKGISVGSVEIIATSPDGPSVTYDANVKVAPTTLKISFAAKCIDKNHVGNRWSKEYYINGDQVKGNGKVLVEEGDIVVISVDIYENDANPDWGGFTEKLEVTPEIMTSGTKLVETVYVTENGGKFSGNDAEWLVTVTIKP